jgi:hypothetical protein
MGPLYPAGYDEKSIRARLSGEMKFEPKPLRETGAKAPQLLIDIQQKLQEGYGKGFENWAKVENLKRSAKTLIYIQKSGIDSYAELERKCRDACGEMMSVGETIKSLAAEQKAINTLQENIGTYRKTLAVYNEYRAINNPKKKQAFYEAHAAAIIRHRAAKKYFDGQGLKGKLPSINSLQEKWGKLEAERRHYCAEYKHASKNFKDLCTAKSNAYDLLGLNKSRQTSRGYGAEI